jgi:hypothetical protein
MKTNRFGSILLKQVLAASRFIGFGSRAAKKDRVPRNEDGSRIIKRYKRGDIGLSLVAAAIQKKYGSILSRRERKRIAKLYQETFKSYYNGPTAEYRRSRNFRRSKYNGKGELI